MLPPCGGCVPVSVEHGAVGGVPGYHVDVGGHREGGVGGDNHPACGGWRDTQMDAASDMGAHD